MTTVSEEAFAKFCNFVRYDEKTGELIWKANRAKGKSGHRVGCINPDGYLQTKMAGKSVLVHRIIWKMKTGKWPENYIDHVNGNKIDNRIANLRDVTPAGNVQNCRLSKTNTSGFMGVSFDKKTQSWRAAIKFQRKSKSLGQFKTPLEAHEAYLSAKKKIHLVNPVPREARSGGHHEIR